MIFFLVYWMNVSGNIEELKFLLTKADMYTLRKQKHLPRAKYSLELPHKHNLCTSLKCFKPVNSDYAEISFLEWKGVIAHCSWTPTQKKSLRYFRWALFPGLLERHVLWLFWLPVGQWLLSFICEFPCLSIALKWWWWCLCASSCPLLSLHPCSFALFTHSFGFHAELCRPVILTCTPVVQLSLLMFGSEVLLDHCACLS